VLARERSSRAALLRCPRTPSRRLGEASPRSFRCPVRQTWADEKQRLNAPAGHDSGGGRRRPGPTL